MRLIKGHIMQTVQQEMVMGIKMGLQLRGSIILKARVWAKGAMMGNSTTRAIKLIISISLSREHRLTLKMPPWNRVLL